MRNAPFLSGSVFKLPQMVSDERLFFFTGIAMILAYSTLAMLLALWQPVNHFRELLVVCQFSGLDAPACHDHAVRVGLTTVGSILLLCMLGYYTLLLCYPSKRKPAEFILPNWAFVAGTSFTVAIIFAHYVFKLSSDTYLSRLATIRHEALFIALENLLWPLLLQLMIIERDKKRYLILLALVLNIATLSPYRAMLMAVIIFGLAVPMLSLWVEKFWLKRASITLPELRFNGLITVLATLALLMGIYSNSQARLIQGDITPQYDANIRYASKNENPATAAIVIAEPSAVIGHPLIQRLIYPLYQATFAERMKTFLDLPNPLVEFTNRVHLTSQPTLNQMLYSMIYRSAGGETTSLLYGEGAAYTASSPFFWCVTVAVFFLFLFSTLYRLGLPCGLLIGLAFWRGSMSGVFNILPSLLVQLGMMAILYFIHKHASKHAKTL